MDTTNDFLKYAHQVEARGNQLAADLIRELTNSHSTIVGKIAKAEADILTRPFQYLPRAKKIKALLLMKKEIEKVLSQVFTEQRLVITDAIKDTWNATTVKTTSIMNAAAGLEIPFPPKLNKAALEAYFQTADIKGLLINEHLEKYKKAVSDKILSISRQCLIEGTGAADLAARLKKEGIEASQATIKGLSRTLLQSAYNNSKTETFKRYADSITGYRYLATLDRQTCLLCGSDDGKLFIPEFPMPTLPRHFNCRCTYIPLTGTKQKATRPAVKQRTNTEKAQVERTKESYNQWLKRQLKEDPAFVRQILGKKRFELFSQGKISLQGMTTDNRIKSLSEIT